MPRPRKSARLWLRPERRQGRRIVAQAVWIILDGGKHYPTGCLKGALSEAEKRLADHIAGKHNPNRRLRDIDEIDVADVLAIYHADTAERQAKPKEFDARIDRLNDYWGGKALSAVNTASCQEYAKIRVKPQAARRDLEDLRAAINHHANEGFHRAVIKVWLPPKAEPRDRWLTRSEAATLLWACWRAREIQTVHKGPLKGEKVLGRNYLRHVARFILIGLYSGTRAGAIATASPYQADGRSFVDLERGVYFRLAQGKRKTKKRQPPAAIAPRLLAHLRRWHRKGISVTYFVEWHGKSVARIAKGFRHAVTLAKLSTANGRVTPHILRHTSATWLMQTGPELWQAAGFLGMTAATLERVYGHHHPAFQQEAARAIGYRNKPVSLVVSLVDEITKRDKDRKTP